MSALFIGEKGNFDMLMSGKKTSKELFPSRFSSRKTARIFFATCFFPFLVISLR